MSTGMEKILEGFTLSALPFYPPLAPLWILPINTTTSLRVSAACALLVLLLRSVYDWKFRFWANVSLSPPIKFSHLIIAPLYLMVDQVVYATSQPLTRPRESLL